MRPVIAGRGAEWVFSRRLIGQGGAGRGPGGCAPGCVYPLAPTAPALRLHAHKRERSLARIIPYTVFFPLPLENLLTKVVNAGEEIPAVRMMDVSPAPRALHGSDKAVRTQQPSRGVRATSYLQPFHVADTRHPRRARCSCALVSRTRRRRLARVTRRACVSPRRSIRLDLCRRLEGGCHRPAEGFWELVSGHERVVRSVAVATPPYSQCRG